VSRTNSERFRMMVWPSHVPPVSSVWGFSPYRLDGDLLKLDPDAQMTEHDVPDEVYLRELRELSLDDPERILEFVNTFGRLGHQKGDVLITSFGPSAPWPTDRQWDDWYAEIDGYSGFLELGPFEKAMFQSSGMQHVDHFRSWALAFRAITDLIDQYHQADADEGQMEDLANGLSGLLHPFYPVVEVAHESDTARRWQPHEESPRLENVLALQAVNHLSQGSIYHVCANETHQGLFVYQRDREEQGQHRSKGVMYCSASCAKAQASREYRRRQKILGEEN